MTDQVQADPKAIEQSPKKETFSEKFDKGWDQVELLTAQENEAKAKETPPKPAEEKQITDDGKSTSEKTPFKVLKVQGKDLPVYSEAELLELAQKGADYTKKTQALAEDRRTAEQQLKDEEKKLADAAFDLNKTLDEIAKLKAGKKIEAEPKSDEDSGINPEEAKIYSDYGIDPKYAQPHEIKIVKDLADVKAGLRSIQQERADAEIHKIISKERETYPYEDVIDDQGQNLTEAQLASIVTAKKAAVEKTGLKADPVKILRESVQELHLAQKKTRETLAIANDMEPDTFAKNFPELAAKLKAKYGADSNATSQLKANVPPAMPASRRDGQSVLPPRKAVAPSGKSMNDWLDEGFADPETIKALNGG